MFYYYCSRGSFEIRHQRLECNRKISGFEVWYQGSMPKIKKYISEIVLIASIHAVLKYPFFYWYSKYLKEDCQMCVIKSIFLS